MMRYLLLALLFSVFWGGCTSQQKAKNEPANKPNVLIIFPDQLRRYSAGFWSENPYRKHVIGKPDPVVTPTIDKLAESGVVATRAISNYPLCSPYRGMLLSGMYPEQNGLWNNARTDRSESLRDDITTITDAFYKAGYNTSYFGKAHWLKPEPLFDKKGNYVGSEEPPGGHFMNQYDTFVPPGPARHNIEYFYQSVKDQHMNPFVYSSDSNAVAGNKDGQVYLPKEFSTKSEAETIVGYLQNDHNQRNTEKPFFMMWSINPPHSPWDDKNTEMDVLRKYYGKDKYSGTDSLVTRKNADPEVASRYVRNYFAQVTSVDHYIGKIISKLKKMGELDNTIIVFTSDHGEMLGSHGRENKNVLYTEAMAIPFIVHWPHGLDPGITDVLLGAPDVYPTVMGLAGMEDQIPSPVQGEDLSAYFENPEKEAASESLLLMLGNSRGLLTDRYQLVLRENKKPWDKKEGTAIDEAYLYDNENDPYQLNKIPLEKRPKIADRLLRQLGRKLKMADDPWYKKKKYSSIISYPE